MKKLLLFIILHSFLFANSCPKWTPIALDDIFTIVPIYPYPTTAPDADCDGVSDTNERLQGSNPHKKDTDGDGVGDYEDDYPTDAHRSVDKTAPVITLKGKSTLVLYKYYTYKEPGATARDDRDGTVSVRIAGNVNTSIPKTYRLTYSAVDARGNKSVKYRTVIVKPEIKPQLIVDSHSPVDATKKRPSSVVQAFIKAYVANDRNKVTELVGSNKKMLAMLYGNAKATAFLKAIYKNVIKIQGKHQNMGNASVGITFIDNKKSHQGGFELLLSESNKWVITFIY